MAGFKQISKNHFRIESRDGKWIYEIYRNDAGEVVCDEFMTGKEDPPTGDPTPAPPKNGKGKDAKEPKPKKAARSIFEDDEDEEGGE